MALDGVGPSMARGSQLENGSWLAAYKDGQVEDGTRAESNFVAYVATGVWHYYLVTADTDFLERMWPVVSRAIGFVLRLAGDHGQGLGRLPIVEVLVGYHLTPHHVLRIIQSTGGA